MPHPHDCWHHVGASTSRYNPSLSMNLGRANDKETASLQPIASLGRATRGVHHRQLQARLTRRRVNDASPVHPVHAWRRHEASAPPRMPDVAGDQERSPPPPAPGMMFTSRGCQQDTSPEARWPAPFNWRRCRGQPTLAPPAPSIASTRGVAPTDDRPRFDGAHRSRVASRCLPRSAQSVSVEANCAGGPTRLGGQ